MTHLVNNIANVGRKINKYDPLDRAAQNFVLGKPAPGTNYYGEAGAVQPTPSLVPQIDEAARNRQQLTRISQRRGVLANLFGGSSATAPTTASKALLGQ